LPDRTFALDALVWEGDLTRTYDRAAEQEEFDQGGGRRPYLIGGFGLDALGGGWDGHRRDGVRPTLRCGSVEGSGGRPGRQNRGRVDALAGLS